MQYHKHTDGQGNVTYEPYIRNTSERSGQNVVPEDDPFAKWQNSMQSIVPPAGVDTTQQLPVAEAPVAAVSAPQAALPQATLQVGQVPGQINQDQLTSYNSFLRDQFIDPSTIGGKTLMGQVPGLVQSSPLSETNQRKMIVPTTNQQFAAMNMKQQDNHWEASMVRAASYLARQGRSDLAVNLIHKVNDLNQERGTSFEQRMGYYMKKLGFLPSNSSNGYAQ